MPAGHSSTHVTERYYICMKDKATRLREVMDQYAAPGAEYALHLQLKAENTPPELLDDLLRFGFGVLPQEFANSV